MKKQGKIPCGKRKVAEHEVDLLPPILTQQEYQRLETEPCKCYGCGSLYPTKNKFFSKTNSKIWAGNNYYIPLCNTCLDKLFVGYVKQFGDKEHAIDRICMHYDIYYNTAIIEEVDSAKPKSYITMYIDKANLTGKAWTGKTYAHTLAEQESEFNRFTETCGEAITSKNYDIEVGDIEVEEARKENIRVWGYGYEPEEYVMLNNNYQNWTEHHICDSHAQEIIYRTMSLLQMKITKGAQNGEKIDGLCKQLNDYMATANIQPKQKNDDLLNDKQTMGVLIEKFEQTRPIPDPEPEWAEKTSMVRYVSVWFLGHLTKMMGLKNKWSNIYEEEIAKYTVKPPQYEDTEEATSDEPTFEQLFGSHIIEE